MPLPSPWVGLVLGLAAYRATRLGGWDDFPPIERIRSWALGTVWHEGEVAYYRRPTLAHLANCPFCLGWWVSLAVYVWWVATPAWGLYPVTPFALSGFVGLVAKNLDP